MTPMTQTGDPREGASKDTCEAWPVDVHSLEMDEPGAIALGNGGHPHDISLAGHPAETIPQLHSEAVGKTKKTPASEPPQHDVLAISAHDPHLAHVGVEHVDRPLQVAHERPHPLVGRV